MSDATLSGPEVSIEDKVAFLGSTRAYATQPSQVEVIETHMSWVFLAGDFAYKLKKPVRYDFLDLSTVEARLRNGENEIRLNRRLAPRVYLGLEPLTLEDDGRLLIAGQGHAIDWLVRMQRLPPQAMLDAKIRDHSVDPDRLRRIADLLIAFYCRADPVNISADDYRRRFEAGLRANRAVLMMPSAGLDATIVEQASGALADFISGEGHRALASRATEGRIVDAHGDLRPEHVCMGPEPVIIDCLEFDQSLRQLDPVDELAYLAMECDRLGAPDVGATILQRYTDVLSDHPGPALIRFYKAYRAFVRAKLAIWHIPEHGRLGPERWRERARNYVALAHDNVCKA